MCLPCGELRDILDFTQIFSIDFDTKLGSKTRSQHLGPSLDWHPEYIGHAGSLNVGVHLGDELVPCHVMPGRHSPEGFSYSKA